MIPLVHSLSVGALFCALGLASSAAQAQPRLWVTVTSDIVYASDGSATAVRHSWKFDKMYSAFATQDTRRNEKGEIIQGELSHLADLNVSLLKDVDNFTFAKADGNAIEFRDPVDYFHDYEPTSAILTLHLTLPFKLPVRAKMLEITVYDPNELIEFEFVGTRPAVLVGAPATCFLSFARADKLTTEGQHPPQSTSKSFGSAPSQGNQFANKITVKCP